MSFPTRVTLVFILLGLSIGTMAGPAPRASTEEIITRLTAVDRTLPGVSASNSFTWFVGQRPSFHGGLLPVEVPNVPPAFEELVRRGVAALPFVLAHLDDRRPTKLIVPEDAGMFGPTFSDEYDPRTGPRNSFDRSHIRGPTGPYSVTVGDVCFAILGEIVNRYLVPVRYQPSAIVIINSTTVAPELVQRARRDWAGLTPAQHRASLIADAQSDLRWRYEGALTRLRFYYPDAYNALSGAARERRERFEVEEQQALERATRARD